MSQAVLREGAVALVAGASAGIGAAIAHALAERGLEVICASRSRERLEALVEALGPGGHALSLDVGESESTETLLARLPEELRAIEVLVNCAGHDVGGRRRFDQGTLEDWASIIDTNVIGTIRVCHAVLPGMLARGRGHVVNLGSVAGLRTYATGSIYNASKFAVRAFTDALRQDYKDTALRVTEILPGLVRTEFAKARHRGDETRAQAFYDDAAETLDAEDIARAVIYALEQPARVNVSQIVIEPTHQ